MKMELEKIEIQYHCDEFANVFELRREDKNRPSDPLYRLCKLHEILNEKIWDVSDLICSLFNDIDKNSEIQKKIDGCIYYSSFSSFEMPNEFVNSIIDILKIPEDTSIQYHIDFFIQVLACDDDKEEIRNYVHMHILLDDYFASLCTFVYKIIL